MKKVLNNRYIHPGYLILIIALLIIPVACFDELDVQNPNDPTFSGNVNSEQGLSLIHI